jgi:hypothetical protein
LTISLAPLVFLAALACGCGEAARPSGLVLTEGRTPPPDVAAACDLAARRCSRCHPIERLLLAQVSRPAHWVRYVERMRRQPESGISEAEGQTITRCLVFRSFGADGLRALEEGTP